MKPWAKVLFLGVTLSLLAVVVAFIAAYAQVSGATDGSPLLTRTDVERRFWCANATVVPDTDIPRGFRETTPVLTERPHQTVRYGILGLYVHAVYDPSGHDVITVIPSYE